MFRSFDLKMEFVWTLALEAMNNLPIETTTKLAKFFAKLTLLYLTLSNCVVFPAVPRF